MDLGRRSRRSVTRARKVREEGDGADRRARGLSESDARAVSWAAALGVSGPRLLAAGCGGRAGWGERELGLP